RFKTLVLPKIELIPIFTVLRLNIKVFEVDGKPGGTLNLDKTTSTERNRFTWRKFQHQFFNESSDVIVRSDFTLPFLNPEDFFRNMDFHILLTSHLTGETHAFFSLFLIHV